MKENFSDYSGYHFRQVVLSTYHGFLDKSTLQSNASSYSGVLLKELDDVSNSIKDFSGHETLWNHRYTCICMYLCPPILWLAGLANQRPLFDWDVMPCTYFMVIRVFKMAVILVRLVIHVLQISCLQLKYYNAGQKKRNSELRIFRVPPEGGGSILNTIQHTQGNFKTAHHFWKRYLPYFLRNPR